MPVLPRSGAGTVRRLSSLSCIGFSSGCWVSGTRNRRLRHSSPAFRAVPVSGVCCGWSCGGADFTSRGRPRFLQGVIPGEFLLSWWWWLLRRWLCLRLRGLQLAPRQCRPGAAGRGVLAARLGTAAGRAAVGALVACAVADHDCSARCAGRSVPIVLDGVVQALRSLRGAPLLLAGCLWSANVQLQLRRVSAGSLPVLRVLPARSRRRGTVPRAERNFVASQRNM